MEEYKVTVKAGGRFFTASGKTSLEALTNVIAPNLKGMIVLTMEHGGKKQDKVLSSMIASNTFNSRGTFRNIQLRNTSRLFNI